jgi:hypothetical protein
LQAPELVHGDSFYSEAIDIYAMAITIWQIWTGNDPFDGVDTFSLYDMIVSGKRPPLPQGAPAGFAEIIADGWDSSAESRVSAQTMADRLTVIVERYRTDIEHHRPSAKTRADSVDSHESMQILGNCSLVDDEPNAIALPMPGHVPRSLSRHISQKYSDEIVSPVHTPMHSPMRKHFTTQYNSLDDTTDEELNIVPEQALEKLNCDISLDMSGYTDDELYQGYGRKSAADIKRSNPLIPQITKSIIAAVKSPSVTKKKKQSV